MSNTEFEDDEIIEEQDQEETPVYSGTAISSGYSYMHISKLIRTVTDDYIRGLGNVKESELIDVADTLLSRIHNAIESVNMLIMYNKDKMLKYPQHLPSYSIAALLAKTGTYAKIRMPRGIYKLLEYQKSGPNYGVWNVIATEDDDNNLNRLILHCECESSDALEKKVYKAMLNLVPLREETLNPDITCVNNGIWNFVKQEFIPFGDPRCNDYTFLRKIHTNYNPNAVISPVFHNDADGTDWDIDSWLKDVFGSDELCSLVWEITHGLVRPAVHYNKAIFMCNPQGNGANGKSTLAMLWKQLLGETTVGNINLEQFGESFALAGLSSYNAVISDENEYGGYVDKCAKFKAMVTHNEVSVNDKFVKAYFAIFHGLIVQQTNNFPKVKDKSGSFYRRLLMLEFNKSFKDIERKYIQDDYMCRTELLEYVLNRILHMDVREFSEPQAVRDTLTVYKSESNPAIAFCNEFLAPDENGHTLLRWNFIPFEFLYDLYRSWYELNYGQKCSYAKDTLKRDVSIWCQDSSEWESTYQNSRTSYKYINQNDIQCPEPLIKDYNLTRWCNNLASYDLGSYCTPVNLIPRYAGLKRL